MSIGRREVILTMVGLVASSLEAKQRDVGPYCSVGKGYVPCGSELRGISVAGPHWLTLDLSDSDGIRVTIQGEVLYVTRSDILTALIESPTKP
jgi:hypothetical protein